MSDEFGYKATVNRVGPADLQATLLYLLGLDHKRLTFPHEGREETPTNVSVTNARVVGDILKKPPKEA